MTEPKRDSLGDRIGAWVAGLGAALGLGGLAVFGATQGTKPIVPNGPYQERSNAYARVIVHAPGRAAVLLTQTPDPLAAVRATMLALGRARGTHPGPQREIRVLLLDDEHWVSWAVQRYGVRDGARAAMRATRQMVGSGMPCLLVHVERDGVLVPWSEVLALVVHETLHVLTGVRGHADPTLWTEAGGAGSVESRAHQRVMEGR
jgi:hypothetical protein